MSDDGLLTRLMRGGFREQEPRLRIDWMTHTDERIMEHLDERGSSGPGAIAASLEKSEEYVADRCRQLAIRDLLAAEGDGEYRLSERGRGFLAGEVEPEELADDED
ncbi:phage repressor protein [Halalkalicoccus tibetensis]|uniref:Phage repressor protein n=1 Tax=Halalkalicoccus tibetensis TaxID=175632 RepID=A0ABD5V1A3_9EURY